MRLVEIAGHNIDPRMVADVGPIIYDGTCNVWVFVVCAGGAAQWRFRFDSEAREAKDSLLAAIEAADQAILDATRCVSRSKHDPYDKLIKALDAEVREAKAALDEWRARKHPRDGGTDLLQAYEALLGVEPTPELRAMPGLDSLMAREGTKICPDLELPSSRGFKGGKGEG